MAKNPTLPTTKPNYDLEFYRTRATQSTSAFSKCSATAIRKRIQQSPQLQGPPGNLHVGGTRVQVRNSTVFLRDDLDQIAITAGASISRCAGYFHRFQGP